MAELPLDSLKLFISDLFIKKIGEIWGIESLATYNFRESISPRCFFLWVNQYTNRFHWIFMNEFVKITKLNDKDGDLKNHIKSLQNSWNQDLKNGEKLNFVNDRLPSEYAKKLLKRKNRQKLILDPTLFLEASKETEFYRNQKGIGKIDRPDIEIEKGTIGDEAFRIKYGDGLGLSMLAVKKEEVFYTPFAILDPRSWQPGFWDSLLGIEETLYLPLKNIKRDKFEGVLIISWDEYNFNNLGLENNFIFSKGSEYDQCRENLKKLREEELKKALKGDSFKEKIKFYDQVDRIDYIEKLYGNYTQDLVEKLQIQKVFNFAWNEIQNDLKIREVMKLLPTLFDNWIESYNNYTFNFDDYIIEKYLSIIENKHNYKDISSVLSRIHSMEENSIDLLNGYIESQIDKIPTISFYKKLEKVEPLLQNIGKKEHYIHMFNVYLLGKVICENYFGESNAEDNTWKEIALSHDLAYPIEAIEEEIKAFFRAYFYKGKTPQLFTSKELLYSYDNFVNYLPRLIERSSKIITGKPEGDYSLKAVLEDLVLFSLYTRADHAIVSALFTISANGRKNNRYTVAIPIFLHNLYQWKFFALREFDNLDENLEELIEDFSESIGDNVFLNVKELEINREQYKFINFIYERRFKDKIEIEMKNLLAKKSGGDNVNIKDSLKEYCLNELTSYSDVLRSIKISIHKRIEKEVKLWTFILSLSDFFQEWGRLTYKEKGKASIGLRVLDLKGTEIVIKCPLLDENELYLYFAQQNEGLEWNVKERDDAKKDIVSKINKNLKESICGKTSSDEPDIETKFWKKMSVEIENHINESMKRSEPSRDEFHVKLALLKNFILKYREFVLKFTFKPQHSQEVFKGLYEFGKEFLNISWEGISSDPYEYIRCRWPK